MSYTSSLGTIGSMPGNIALGWTHCIIVTAQSSIELVQAADVRLDYLTAFDTLIPLLGLHADSQGEHALVHALLQYAARNADRRDARYSNPCSEVLHQLELAGVNDNALQYLRRFFNTASEAYSRR